MDAQRLFVALEFSDEIIQALDRVIQFIKKQNLTGIHWSKAENIHLTIRFLGDVYPDRLGAVKDLLSKESLKTAPFSLGIEKLGAFPNLRHPKVIWVGVNAPQECYSFQNKIEMGSRQIGFKPEDRPFSPHLTLGRINMSASAEEITRISRYLSEFEINTLGTCLIQQITLFKSDLNRNGSIYTSLQKYFFLKEQSFPV